MYQLRLPNLDQAVKPDKVLYEMMMNTVCNSNLLFIKYIYYTVQVEFCYNVAHMCRASSSLVELCSLCCPSSK